MRAKRRSRRRTERTRRMGEEEQKEVESAGRGEEKL